MSFQKVKPTKPELDRLKKRLDFTKRGKDLLKLKREQLLSRLRETAQNFFDKRSEMRTDMLEKRELLEKTYESIGKRTISRISNLHKVTLSPDVDIIYRHEVGLDIPKITLSFDEENLPSYSYTTTSLYMDILIKKLKESIEKIVNLAELDNLMYKLAEEFKKVQRRLDALDDIIIPKLKSQIVAIEDILSDESQEEFIRMKKVKESLEIKEKL